MEKNAGFPLICRVDFEERTRCGVGRDPSSWRKDFNLYKAGLEGLVSGDRVAHQGRLSATQAVSDPAFVFLHRVLQAGRSS